MIQKLKHWVFRWFGPPEIQQLNQVVDDTLEQSGAEQVIVLPLGEFPLNIRTSMDEDIEPLIFSTVAERGAYIAGIEYGCYLCGAQTAPLSDEDLQTMDEMRSSTTHGDSKKNTH